MPTCTGCLAQFSSSASLSSHLTQTQNIVCIAVRNSLEYFTGHTEIRPDAGGHGVDCLQAFDDIDHADHVTSGDIYETRSFRSFEASRGLCDDSEDNDDNEENNSKSSLEGHGDSSEDEFSNLDDPEDSWEAPTTHCNLSYLEVDLEMTGVNSDADESSNCHAHAALQQTRSKQMFLDRYPSNAAGHPVSTSFMPNANHRYAEQLTCQVDASSGGARNPYWPFTS